MLRHWKAEAEKRAAREANARGDVVAELIEDLADTRDMLVGHAAVELADYPIYSRWDLPFEERTRLGDEARNKRRDVYNREIMPRLRNCLDRCEQILGPDDPLIVDAEHSARIAVVNALAREEMAEKLESLRTALEFR